KAPYIAMEFVEGKDLKTTLEELPAAQKMPHRECARILRDVANAMAIAHEEGVIHRDLKPANILIAETKRPGEPRWPVVTDFGLAKLCLTNAVVVSGGRVSGTAAYMSPEQAMGNRDAITGQSDVYSLG